MVRSVNVSLEGAGLTPSQVQQVARYRARVTLSQDARKRLQRARAVVDGLVDRGEVVYGLNTGVGALRTTKIAPSEVRRLQRNLVRSHAVGVGPLLEEELVRAGMLVRVNQFCQGSSGVRPEVAERLIDLLNHDVCPCVPEKGSLGASGDLAPSAHVGLVLMGEGQVGWAARIWAMTEGSEIIASHAECDRVQDAYSLRCAAQVHGASADALDYLSRVLAVELNAGTDNPMVFPDQGAVISGGNFHG